MASALGSRGAAQLGAPEHTSLAFAQALSVGHVEAAAACFSRDGCLITPDATAVRGREAVRAVLAQLVARRIEITVELSGPLSVGDIAFIRERWTIRSNGPDGTRLSQTSAPTFVLRNVDASWKLLVASPWG